MSRGVRRNRTRVAQFVAALSEVVLGKGISTVPVRIKEEKLLHATDDMGNAGRKWASVSVVIVVPLRRRIHPSRAKRHVSNQIILAALPKFGKHAVAFDQEHLPPPFTTNLDAIECSRIEAIKPIHDRKIDGGGVCSENGEQALFSSSQMLIPLNWFEQKEY